MNIALQDLSTQKGKVSPALKHEEPSKPKMGNNKQQQQQQQQHQHQQFQDQQSGVLPHKKLMLINGRLSDILGRKQLLLCSLAMLAVGNLITGFTRTPGKLFAFRALSGLGGGAITALVQIIASDVTTLQQRGCRIVRSKKEVRRRECE
ncbi:hypothetical protein K504DRAFT_534322 [Pleomassaria siparia CBS 279.74]|uniref:Major facilitator superfamily (MFS) profile domain-containing protein n=1 Tax=Pleomassaria siparia CBS 279.74 TaxID=1314801 RepID=A0A6G1K876_9PLEO|nr:hypothetical protein K504DRAFT_534322 [Pleomassaria siparia CBS 279.74]